MFVEKPVPDIGRLGPRRFLPDRIRCTSFGIFRTDRIALAGVCDRSLSEGAVTCPDRRLSLILPGLSLPIQAGSMPSLREGDRYLIL